MLLILPLFYPPHFALFLEKKEKGGWKSKENYSVEP
jgi:hypothetical protein